MGSEERGAWLLNQTPADLIISGDAQQDLHMLEAHHQAANAAFL